MVSKEAVMEALASVRDPELNRPLVDLGMIESVEVDESGHVEVKVLLTVQGCPLKQKIINDVRQAVLPVPGVEGVGVDLGVMSDEQRQGLVNNSMGVQEAKSRVLDPDSPTRVLAIASGKGGVGKSTTTVNLAAALYKRGYTVGILDADIYGFSVPGMLAATGRPRTFDGAIAPMYAHGMQLMSMGFLVEKGTPIVWRGPMLMRAVDQFLRDVMWGDPDYLLIDLPPGTGDVPLTICQKLPRSEMIVVTTPQETAVSVAIRAAGLAAKADQAVLGVIENMSYYICPNCDDREYLFGRGGGERLANEVGVPLLGQVPLEPAVRQGSDEGTPIVFSSPESESAKAFMAMAEKIEQTEPKRQQEPTMVSLEDRLG